MCFVEFRVHAGPEDVLVGPDGVAPRDVPHSRRVGLLPGTPGGPTRTGASGGVRRNGPGADTSKTVTVHVADDVAYESQVRLHTDWPLSTQWRTFFTPELDSQ